MPLTENNPTMTELLLLTIDSLRYDHFTQHNFPNCWERFQENFTIFTNNYANGIATPFSFPSIHTGYPVKGNGSLSSNEPTIAELYDGYTCGLSNNPHLRPERGYDRGFDSFSDSLSSDTSSENIIMTKVTNLAKRSDTVRKAYRRLMQNISDSYYPDLDRSISAERITNALKQKIEHQSGFFWAHYMDPHRPFAPQRIHDEQIDTEHSLNEVFSMNRRFMSKDNSKDTLYKGGELTDYEIESLKTIYSELIKYVDRQLNHLFDYFEHIDRWTDMMVVIMSDHGEAFGEHGIYSHDWTSDPIDELIHVPLLVKFPGDNEHGRTYDHIVQNGDLLATLADEFSWDVEFPPHTKPFTDQSGRFVISKSNAAMRITTETGYAIRNKQGIDVQGEISDEAITVLKEASFPTVENMSGDIPGMSERREREIKEQLEYLGYK